MIIRTQNGDNSSTICSVSAKTIGKEKNQSILITNDKFEGKQQLINYSASIPINVEIDYVEFDSIVTAVDHTNTPSKLYYPLKGKNNKKGIQGYVEVLKRLVSEIIIHLKQNKFI